MREIKFRFYSKHEKRRDISHTDITLEELEDNDSWQGSSPWVRIGTCQFTGLTDKNGVEIYQGDILELNNETYDPEYEGFYVGKAKVTAQTCGFALEPIPKLTEPNPYDSSMFWHVGKENTTEVIGNIYENKELLK